jgi:hypothetical protein
MNTTPVGAGVSMEGIAMMALNMETATEVKVSFGDNVACERHSVAGIATVWPL